MASATQGQTCRSSLSGASLTHAAAAERTLELQALVNGQRRNHDLWHNVWVPVLGVAAAGQAILAGQFDEERRRVGFLIGSIKSFLGMSSVALAPNAAARLRQVITGDPCADLALIENQLLELAASQRSATSLFRTLLGLVLNTSTSLLVGLVWDDWVGAATGFASGFGVNQFFLRTHPTGAIDAVEGAQASNDSETISVEPAITPVGLGLRLRF